MSVKLSILSFFVSVFLCSCSSRNDNFKIPIDVQLNSYLIVNPFFIESLIAPPIKFDDAWNDSLVALTKINQIEILFKGKKSPDNIAEKYLNVFNDNGKLKEYSYFNYEISKSEFCKIFFGNNPEIRTIRMPINYGKKAHQDIVIIKKTDQLLYIRTKENTRKDTTFIFLKNDKPQMIIDKLDEFISKIHFIIDINKPLVSVKDLLSDFNLSDEQLLLAEKIVTFTDHGLPQKSYLINEFFVKQNMVEEWIYENQKKLVAFKKYVNDQVVKEFEFQYSKNKLMNSFTFDRKVYTVNYR